VFRRQFVEKEEINLTEQSRPTRSDPTPTKPSWRGWIHAAAVPLSIILGSLLVVLAEGFDVRVTCTVFAVCSTFLFGSSAAYHRFSFRHEIAPIMRRLDHSNIFLLIGGTYTPVAWCALSQEKSVFLLSLVWSLAIVGIFIRIIWSEAPRWSYVFMYVTLGWTAVAYLEDFYFFNPTAVVLIVIGGIIYSSGALVYARKKPDPIPQHFGFHEIFHLLTVVAFLFHWLAVYLIATTPQP